jgi:shikimate kinase
MNGDPEQVLAELTDRRDPLYREIASLVVETDGRSVADVAAEIRARLDVVEAPTR